MCVEIRKNYELVMISASLSRRTVFMLEEFKYNESTCQSEKARHALVTDYSRKSVTWTMVKAKASFSLTLNSLLAPSSLLSAVLLGWIDAPKWL